ncbi:hypothetical protein EVAR_103726_1 [Eumeta japonica]|uniref:Uncharacterized protein n=1 Tax=Eumeta variegata TaxID=151549 RepID=A0A4C1ZGH6_EUMVA|nr:hypothetical protein EVAR_103726_1 [Eumeta japonica]
MPPRAAAAGRAKNFSLSKFAGAAVPFILSDGRRVLCLPSRLILTCRSQERTLIVHASTARCSKLTFADTWSYMEILLKGADTKKIVVDSETAFIRRRLRTPRLSRKTAGGGASVTRRFSDDLVLISDNIEMLRTMLLHLAEQSRVLLRTNKKRVSETFVQRRVREPIEPCCIYQVHPITEYLHTGFSKRRPKPTPRALPQSSESFRQDFLKDKYFRLRIEGTRSSSRPIVAGVPQVFMLSPILYFLVLKRLTVAS